VEGAGSAAAPDSRADRRRAGVVPGRRVAAAEELWVCEARPGAGVEGARRHGLPGGAAHRDHRLLRRTAATRSPAARGPRRVRLPRPVRLVATPRPGRRRSRPASTTSSSSGSSPAPPGTGSAGPSRSTGSSRPAAASSPPPSRSTSPPPPAGSPAACSPSSTPSRPSGSARCGRRSTPAASPPAAQPPGSRSGATSTTSRPRSTGLTQTRRLCWPRSTAGTSPGSRSTSWSGGSTPAATAPSPGALVGPHPAPGPRLRVRRRPVLRRRDPPRRHPRGDHRPRPVAVLQGRPGTSTLRTGSPGAVAVRALGARAVRPLREVHGRRPVRRSPAAEVPLQDREGAGPRGVRRWLRDGRTRRARRPGQLEDLAKDVEKRRAARLAVRAKQTALRGDATGPGAPGAAG
jgi:hypothetical protein